MKVLTIGNFNRGWDGSICDEEHIAGALEELGHEVVRSQRGETGYLVQDYDFTLVAQYDGYHPDMVANLPKPVVYWAFDYQADGQEWHERLIAESDLYLSKRIADSKYSNWQWLSQDFAPKFLDVVPKLKEEEKDIDVLFTGSYLPWATERNQTLKAIDEHFNLVIHSVNPWEGFKDVRPPIMDEGLPELYDRARINISIDHTIESGYWSDRNAQIMVCGGFVLFREVPLYELSFHHSGTYLETFNNSGECLAKITYWLNRPFERGMKAEQGRMYAGLSLMVFNRVTDLLNIVERIL